MASGLGISIVPGYMQKSRSEGFCYIALEECEIIASIGLVHRADESSPLVRNLLALVPGPPAASGKR